MEKDSIHRLTKEIRGLRKVANVFLIVLIIYILFVLKQFFIPIALALFFAVLLIPLVSKLVKAKFPMGLSVATISISFLGLIFLFGLFISKMAGKLINESDDLKVEITEKIADIELLLENLGGDYFDPDKISESLRNIVNPDFIFGYTGDLASFVGSFTTDFLLMFFYLVGFLSAIQNYRQFLIFIFGSKDEARNSRILTIFDELKSSLSKYMIVKIFISLGTGLGYAIACYIFGVKHAVIWGFLAFCLNFIPTIGSIMATIPPLLLGIIQFDSFVTLLIFGGVLFSIQFLFGNILEPKIQGSSFKINFVSIIIGLVLFGGLWGIIGMLLSVPLLVLLKLILIQFPDAKFIVRLMSTNREVREWSESNQLGKEKVQL